MIKKNDIEEYVINQKHPQLKWDVFLIHTIESSWEGVFLIYINEDL